MTQTKSVPIQNNQYSTPVNYSRNNNHMTSPRSEAIYPSIYIFTNPNIFSPPIASLKTQLKKNNIAFQVKQEANKLKQIFLNNRQKCLAIIETNRQSATDISWIFPQKFVFPQSNQNIHIITYPNSIIGTKYQSAKNPGQVLSQLKKFSRVNETNKIRLKKVHTSKDIKFQQSPLLSPRQVNSPIKGDQQFFQKLYYYDPPNESDAQYKLLIQSLKNIEYVFPFAKLQEVTNAAKQLKKSNKLLTLVSHNQAPVLKRHIEYNKKQKQIQFIIFGVDQPRKQLMSPNMYFASNNALQIIDQLSKIGFSRMFDCRRKYQDLSNHKKFAQSNSPQQHQFMNSLGGSKFSRIQLNRISQRSGASIFSNASSQQQRYVRNWAVDKDPNNNYQYRMIQQNKEQYDQPLNQLQNNSRHNSLSNRSRKSLLTQNNRLGDQFSQSGYRNSLDKIQNRNEQIFRSNTNIRQNNLIDYKNQNQENSQKTTNVKKIVKLTKTTKDPSISNISSNQSIQHSGKPPYQQMPSNVIQQTSEQYRGSNRQSIVNMEDNFYHYQGNQSSNNQINQSGTNLSNSAHQNSGLQKRNGSGFNKIKTSTTALEPIQQATQKRKIIYNNNYIVPQQSHNISSSQYLLQNPSQKLLNTVNYNQTNVYGNMSMAPKIINGLTGELEHKQSKSKTPLIINGLTGQLYPTEVLRLNNGSHEQQINARYYSPTHVVKNHKITPEQIRMPHSSTSTGTANQLSNKNLQNTTNNERYSNQIKRQSQSTTSIKQHVNINSNSSSNYKIVSPSTSYNQNGINKINYITYNDSSQSVKNNSNDKNYGSNYKVYQTYNNSSSNNHPSNYYYRNNAGIYNIPNQTPNNVRILSPSTKNVNYTQKRTYINNNLNIEDQDPFHQDPNNKSKLKGSYLNREIDGKLDPYSPYEGSGIKVDRNNSENKTKITYLNGIQTKNYDKNTLASPTKYQVYDLKDNKITVNSPSVSNFNIYKGTNSYETKNTTNANVYSKPSTQVKRIVIGIDGVRRQITGSQYQSRNKYQNSTSTYERANMITSPVRQVKIQGNSNYVSPGKVNVTGGYTGYTGINLDQYEAHVDQNGRTIYKKKSIGILGQDSNINYRTSSNTNIESLKKYQPTRRQYTNSPTRRGQEIKQSAFRRISVQKPTTTVISNNHSQSPNVKSYQDTSYQNYNENGYNVKKYTHQTKNYEQNPHTYGNNFYSLKESSQSIQPLVYDAKNPTRIQTYRGQNVVTTYESPRRHVVQKKQYRQPKVTEENEKRNSKEAQSNNINNQKLVQKQKLKSSNQKNQTSVKNSQKLNSNNENKKGVDQKNSSFYEISDASIMRRNNNRFGVNLYKKQKKLDQSFQFNELKSKIKSKIFTLSDLNKKMMVNRVIQNQKQIEEQRKKFSYIDTEINYFHFLVDQQIGHLKLWVQNYIFAKNDKLQVFRGVQDLYQKVKNSFSDEYYSQNDIGFILAAPQQITKINKNLLPQNYYIIDLISPDIFNGIQISQLDKKVKLSKLSNLKLAQKIILQSKLNHILLYQKKNTKDIKNVQYQKQVQEILNIFPQQQFIKQFYEGQITGDLMDGLIDDFRFNRLYIICDQKQMQNVIKQLNIIQKQEGFPKQICKIICLPKDNQILKYENLIEKHPEVAWITNVSKINDYKSLIKYASKQSLDDKQKNNVTSFQKQRIFYHIRHKNLQQILQKQFPGKFIIQSFTSLSQVQKKIMKTSNNLTKTIKNSTNPNNLQTNYLILHPTLSQQYLNFKLFKKIFMLGKSDKIQRKVIRVSTNNQLIELLRQ